MQTTSTNIAKFGSEFFSIQAIVLLVLKDRVLKTKNVSCSEEVSLVLGTQIGVTGIFTQSRQSLIEISIEPRANFIC